MASGPITTIPPFADTGKLPPCAISCGVLHDVNGACVPPGGPAGEPSAYTACFCGDARVSPFSTAAAGVCDGVCQPDAATSIMNWFQDICSVENNNNNGGNNGGNNNGGDNGGNNGGNGDSGSGNDNSGDTGSGSSGSGNRVGQQNNGDWLSNHWQWVVMLVVLVVAIAGIWVGACIWRRRYLRKKDRQSTLPQKQSGSVSHPSWGPGMGPSPSDNAPGVFMPGTAAAGSGSASPSPYEEKPKKKWTVNERT
ncbi:hypothetical protein HJFPF1_06165 [Paramyrothecium foliicola]|nr:hypothetical protein HJFPF1_06165 [Paramyrothecium foliicola]